MAERFRMVQKAECQIYEFCRSSFEILILLRTVSLQFNHSANAPSCQLAHSSSRPILPFGFDRVNHIPVAKLCRVTNLKLFKIVDLYPGTN